MIAAGIPGKSKSPSVPLLQRGGQVEAIDTGTCFPSPESNFRADWKQSTKRMAGPFPPFEKGGQGGFALCITGESP